MNGKQSKNIRRNVRKMRLDSRQRAIKDVCEVFNWLSFRERLKVCLLILRRKLSENELEKL